MMLVANAILVGAAALWLDSRMSAHDAFWADFVVHEVELQERTRMDTQGNSLKWIMDHIATIQLPEHPNGRQFRRPWGSRYERRLRKTRQANVSRAALLYSIAAIIW